MSDKDCEEKLDESEINHSNISKMSQSGKADVPVDSIVTSVMNRPPKRPGPSLGPYFQFVGTDLEKMLWVGSVLILRDVSLDRPKMEFTCESKVLYDWEVLYENLFSMRAYRINLQVELVPGEGDSKVLWSIDWGDFCRNGIFHIARYDQKWRGGFFSCNGFDSESSKQHGGNLNYDNVWNHLHSIHEETPLHILLWGGDQIYMDFVFEDIPFLRDWLNMEWDQRWKHHFDEKSKIEVEEYYFNAYMENWECRHEMKRALESIPSLMMWDDHDIFDGAGSYPPLLNHSPVMKGLVETAQKMRLLFQHHTTLEKARQHNLFGYHGYNFFARCGPKLGIIGGDGRSERDGKTVQHEKSWEIIFDKLDKDLEGVEQLMVVFPIPFSYVRFPSAEIALGGLRTIASIWHNISFIQQTNSIFGLPELDDDLLDEWTHGAHLAERNRVLARFQQISEEKKVRITFFSGDVHCCGVSRFRTSGINPPLPINDNKLMYQIISSAIVNMPPSRAYLCSLHLLTTKWDAITNTEEEIIDFFKRSPEDGTQIDFQKFLPNRNWCYFEQSRTNNHDPLTNNDNNIPIDSTANRDDQGNTSKGTEKNFHELSDTQKINSLKVRLWLESNEKQKNGTKFASYDLDINNLK